MTGTSIRPEQVVGVPGGVKLPVRDDAAGIVDERDQLCLDHPACDFHMRAEHGVELPHLVRVTPGEGQPGNSPLNFPAMIKEYQVDGLIENGYNVRLANPAAIHQYDGIKNTDDDTDAFFLAELDRLKILPEAFIYPKIA